MKQFARILSLVLLYLLFTAKSCNDRPQEEASREQSRIEATKDSLKSVFSSDTISTEFLDAMAVDAGLKLSDFYDFIKIINDSSSKDIFKVKAAGMIRSLFASENIHIENLHGKQTGTVITLEQLLHPGNTNPITREKLVPGSIKVFKPFQKVSDTAYAGILSCKVQTSCVGNGEADGIPVREKRVEMLLLKRLKVIGGDPLKVWTVLLGDMKRL
jgi:hypothetical protein